VYATSFDGRIKWVPSYLSRAVSWARSSTSGSNNTDFGARQACNFISVARIMRTISRLPLSSVVVQTLERGTAAGEVEHFGGSKTGDSASVSFRLDPIKWKNKGSDGQRALLTRTTYGKIDGYSYHC
jgi:hypothetical protein